jgi:hypothetical protein
MKQAQELWNDSCTAPRKKWSKPRNEHWLKR